MKLAGVMLIAAVGVAHADAPGADLPPPSADGAWELYDSAFVDAAQGRDRGRRELYDLVDEYPNHPATVRARTLLGRRGLAHDRRVARGELILWQTFGGIVLGGVICSAGACQDARTTAAIFTGTIAGAFALSLVASDDMEEGEARLYNSAATWGLWNGAALTDRTASAPIHAAMMIGGQAAGLASAYALWRVWRPTDGDVALANSGLLWSTVLYLWADLAERQTPVLHDVVLAGDVGLVVGGLVSTRWHISRGRSLLIDTGGLLGILGGGLGAAILGGSSARAGAAVFAGTALGLAAGVWLSKNWDHPMTVSPMAIAGPATHGAGVAATLRF